MNLKKRLNSIRNTPHSAVSIERKLFHILLIFIFGLSLGFLAKYVEGVPHIGTVGDLLNLIGNIGTEIGIWVFIAAIIGAWSTLFLRMGDNCLTFADRWIHCLVWSWQRVD